MVKLLVELKADVNSADKDGQPGLILAAGAGHVDAVKALLELSAGVSLVSGG